MKRTSVPPEQPTAVYTSICSIRLHAACSCSAQSYSCIYDRLSRPTTSTAVTRVSCVLDRYGREPALLVAAGDGEASRGVLAALMPPVAAVMG
jgi:hypothetical protein